MNPKEEQIIGFSRPKPELCLLLLFLGAVCLVGCVTQQSESTGSAAIQVLGRPEPLFEEPTAESTSTDVATMPASPTFYVSAKLQEPAVKPVYPKEALKASTGMHTAYLVVEVDRSGNVTNVSRSPTRVELPTRFSDEYFRAAREAILQWKFSPAMLIHQERKAEGAAQSRKEEIPDTVEIVVKFSSDGTVRM